MSIRITCITSRSGRILSTVRRPESGTASGACGHRSPLTAASGRPVAGSSCDDERTDLARLNQPPNASAAGSLIGPGRSWRVRSLAAIGRDFRRRRPAPSKGTASRHLDQPNQSLRHSRLSEHPQTGSTAPADKVTTPALLPPMTQPVEVRWKGLRAGARLSPWDIFGGSTLPSVSHRRTGTYEQQEAEARDRKVQREAEGAREEPIHPAWSAD